MEINNFHNIKLFKTYVSLSYVLKHIRKFRKNYKSTPNIITKSVAKELAPRGIRCNAVAPGFIKTDMTENQIENPLLGMIPLGRMGNPQDVAEAVAYLVNADYVTGEVLRVDGGIAM